MDILKMIGDQVSNPETLGKLGRAVGMPPAQVQQVAEIGLPTLLQALGRNAGTADGASSLAVALDQHQDDNVDDVNGFLDNVNTKDGAKMLEHIFAGSSDKVHSNIAKQIGSDARQVSGVMTQLAPLVLGALAQQKKQKNLDSSGVLGLLTGLMGLGEKSGIMGMVTNLLDADKDGSISDEVGGMIKGFMKK